MKWAKENSTADSMANAAFELELQTMASEERDADMRNVSNWWHKSTPRHSVDKMFHIHTSCRLHVLRSNKCIQQACKALYVWGMAIFLSKMLHTRPVVSDFWTTMKCTASTRSRTSYEASRHSVVRRSDGTVCQAVKQHGPNKWELLMMGQLLPFLLEQIPFLLRIATLLKLLMNISAESNPLNLWRELRVCMVFSYCHW